MKPLTNETEFTVGEEKVLNYVLAFLFFALFAYGLADAIHQGFSAVTYVNYLFVLAIIPAAMAFAKARSKRVYIRINKTGIYEHEKLVTSWPTFLKAYITQKEVVMSIRDNFLLVVEYYKDDPKKGFRRKIALTNTQNKSEEEIMKAIQFFVAANKPGYSSDTYVFTP
jgi:hypothetical protein